MYIIIEFLYTQKKNRNEWSRDRATIIVGELETLILVTEVK